jgi:acyl-CoA synthetase (AMP-forming)/AMP-acid ligase II
VAVVYGSTEAEPIGHQFWDEVGEEDRQRMAQGGGLLVGRAVPQVALRILPNSAGEPIEPMSRQAFEERCLPGDRPGEVVVTGEHVLQGYLDGVGDEETKFRVHPEASFQAAESVKDLGGDSGRAEVWHRTGDAGYLDASDRLWLLGRASEVIRDGRGELHPFAVEAAVSHVVRPAALVALGEQRVLVLPKRQRHLEDHVWAALSWAEVDRIAYVKRIPMDRRHNAKVDYPALRKMLSR